jgi:hypothetical protein
MLAFLTGLFLGVVLGWVTLWTFLNAEAARFVRRILVVLVRSFGVIVGSAGAGVLIWAAATLALGERLDRLVLIPGSLDIKSPGEALALGGGLLAAGGTALGLSFLGRREKKPAPAEQEPA